MTGRFAFRRSGRLILTLAFIGISAWLLREATREIELSEIASGLGAVSAPQLVLAVLATVVSFIFIGLLDLMSLKDIAPGRVPRRVSMATGAAATAVSNLLGAAYVTGVGVRYRVYSRFGIGGGEVASLFAYNTLAYSLGALVLYGSMLSLRPASIQDSLPISPLFQTVIGLSLLAVTASGWALIRLRAGRPVRIRGHEIPMPGFGTAVGLTGAVVFDLVASGLVLHLLYPPDLSIGFFEFLAVFGIAISLGILSHAPGGLGVFEATILTATGAHGRADALAALILYRAIYTILPFLVAMLAAALFEARQNREGIAYAARLVLRAVLSVARGLKVGLALAGAGVLLASGPRLAGVPGAVAAVAGVLLLGVAGAFLARRRWAWAVATAVLCIGAGALMVEGLAVRGVLLLALIALPLGVLHRAVTRGA